MAVCFKAEEFIKGFLSMMWAFPLSPMTCPLWVLVAYSASSFQWIPFTL